MEPINFSQFQAEFFRMYNEKDYAGALAYIERHRQQLADHEVVIVNWSVCTAALKGDKELALRYFRSALADGFWFAPDALRGDPDLASMQDVPEYQRMVDVCAQRQEQAVKEAKPELEVYEPLGKRKAYPLVIALHPWGSTARAYGKYYQFLLRQGWLVASAQSSQIVGKDLYCWDDAARGAAEIVAHFEELKKGYPIDLRRVLLAGFSQGAGLSISLSISRQIPATGFIALGPYIQNWDEFAAGLPAGRVQNLRGYLLTGEHEQDPSMFEKVETLLKKRAVPYRRQNLAGLGHEIPPNFEELLENAVEFLQSQERE